MEKTETVNPPVETPPEAVKRVARCLECSNEWIASNGAEKKPSRCPTCMSRDVKWRDECTGDEISKKELKSTVKRRTTKRAPQKRNANGSFAKSKPDAEPEEDIQTQAPAAEPEPIPPRPPTPAPMQVSNPQPQAYEEEDEEEEFTYQDAVNAVPKIPMQTVVLLLGAAAAVGVFFFLWGKIKGNRPLRVEQPKEQTAEQIPEQTYSQPIIYSFGGNLA